MKVFRTLSALVALLTAVTTFATQPPSLPRSPDAEDAVVLQANCDEVLGLASTPTPMVITLFDRSTKPVLANLQKLAKPACRSVHGAKVVSREAGEEYPWINSLPFVLEDSLDGLADQAQFRRGLLLAEFSQSVHVGAGMFSAYSDDEMVWVIGHELGHGVYEHSLKKKAIGLVGAALAFVAFLIAFASTRSRVRKLGAAACILTGLTTVLSIAHLNPRQELASDVFGVRTLTYSGIALQNAKAVAVGILNRHQEAEESPLSKAGILPASHPPARIRIDNIQGRLGR